MRTKYHHPMKYGVAIQMDFRAEAIMAKYKCLIVSHLLSGPPATSCTPPQCSPQLLSLVNIQGLAQPHQSYKTNLEGK